MATSAGISPYVSNFGITTVTSSTTITAESHAGKTIVVNAATGATLTLPDASGSGNFYVITNIATQTSDLVIQVPNADNVMKGVAVLTGDGFNTASASDTITLNGTTKGGVEGTKVTLHDVAADIWQVTVDGASSGTAATPFSSSVS